MKTTYLFILFLGFGIANLKGQWNIIYSLEGACMQDIEFTTSENGFFAAGNIIGKSDNSGLSWTLDTVSGLGLKIIDFINQDTGIICCHPGDSEDLLVTYNGGIDWNYPALDQGISLGNADLVDGGNVIYTSCLTSSTKINVANDYYAINIASNDIGSSPDCYELHFVSQNVGYLTGFFTEELYQSTIYKTVDGGFSWYTNENMYGPLYYISFPTPDIGYGIGYENRVWKTSNSGESWEMLTYDFGGIDVYEIGFSLGKIYFYTENIGYLSAIKNNDADNEAYIYKTIDGGETWFKTDFDVTGFSIYDIVCTSEDICYAITCSDIYKTTNGGGIDTTKTLITAYEKFTLNLYPNPTDRYLHIQIPDEIQVGTYEIVNTLGQLVMQNEFYTKYNLLNVEALAKGLYTINIIANTAVYSLKFIKN